MCALCTQEGDNWRPPSALLDNRWHYKAPIQRVLTGSLLCENDLLQAICIILTIWDGQGARGAVIPPSSMKKYVHHLSVKKLLGPRRDSKTEGVPRYIFAAVPVARLLTNRRVYIRALLEDNYRFDSPPAPTKE